jgi:hypothetical protein
MFLAYSNAERAFLYSSVAEINWALASLKTCSALSKSFLALSAASLAFLYAL